MKWLYERAHTKKDHPFINGYTYEDIYRATIATATRLAPYVKGESRIALWSENSIAMAIQLLALWALGKEVVLLNTMLTGQEAILQLRLTDTTCVLVSEEQRARLDEASLSQFLEERSMFMFHGPKEGIKEGMIHELEVSFSSLVSTYFTDKSEESPLALDWNPNPSNIAVIIHTSATSGTMKSVPLRWKQIEAHVMASQQALGVDENDHWLVVLPMFHVSGLSVLWRTLYNGTSLTIHSKVDENRLIETIQSGSITMISLVPTILQRIIHSIDAFSMRVILLGGEFIPQSLMKVAMERQLPVYKTYGMSETCSQSTTFNLLEHPEHIDSVGLPLEGVQIEIRQADQDGIGEIWLQSPMVMDGYLDGERLTGAFHTEDIGYVDEDGFLYVVNRRKDIIISGGENIYPKEIEDILYTIPGIEACALVPVDDERWGQVPVLCIISHLSDEAILHHLKNRVAKYKWPKEIVRLHHFPKNAMGKVLRHQLQDYARQVYRIRSQFKSS